MWLILVRPFLVAAAVIVATLLIAHVRLGSDSPGLSALWTEGWRFWYPLLVFFFFFLPVLQGLWIMWLARRNARRGGLSLVQYLRLSQEDKLALADPELADRSPK
jgi:hypothetical protein